MIGAKNIQGADTNTPGFCGSCLSECVVGANRKCLFVDGYNTTTSNKIRQFFMNGQWAKVLSMGRIVCDKVVMFDQKRWVKVEDNLCKFEL